MYSIPADARGLDAGRLPRQSLWYRREAFCAGEGRRETFAVQVLALPNSIAATALTPEALPRVARNALALGTFTARYRQTIARPLHRHRSRTITIRSFTIS